MSSPVSDVLDRFAAARGDADDETWAGAAVLYLARHEVVAPRMRQALTAAVEHVEETGESPDDLFGPPTTWAREQIDGWVGDGVGYLDESVPDANTLVSVTGVTSVVIATFLIVAFALKARWFVEVTVGWLALPVLGSLTCTATLAVRERLLDRYSGPVSLAGAGAVGLIGAAATTASVMLGTGVIARVGLAWLLLYPLALAALTWVAARLVPEPRPCGGAEAAAVTGEDGRWLRRAGAALRRRGDLSEREVRTHLRDARAHAAATGAPLAVDFGDPTTYASGFPRRTDRVLRRKAVLATVVAVGVALLWADSDRSLFLSGAALLWILFTLQTWWAWWRHHATHRRHHP